jgi:hypothetical protein
MSQGDTAQCHLSIVLMFQVLGSHAAESQGSMSLVLGSHLVLGSQVLGSHAAGSNVPCPRVPDSRVPGPISRVLGTQILGSQISCLGELYFWVPDFRVTGPRYRISELKFQITVLKGRHYTQHNDIQHSDTQHKLLLCDNQHKRHSALQCPCHYTECHFFVMLNVVMPSVIMLSVVAPLRYLISA